MDPNFLLVNQDLARVYSAKGMHKEAIAQLQKSNDLLGGNPGGIATNEAWLGYAYGLAGRRQDALKIVDTLKNRSRRMYVSPLSIALVYAGLGDKDKAFQWLDKAYNEHSGDMNLLKVNPTWDPLRSDPRFQDLLRRMNFPP